MSAMPFSVRVCIRMDVPRKPVWRHFPWSSKFLRRRPSRSSFALPSTTPVLSANRAGVCIVFRIAVLNSPPEVRKRDLMNDLASVSINSYFEASLPVASAIWAIIPASIAQ